MKIGRKMKKLQQFKVYGTNRHFLLLKTRAENSQLSARLEAAKIKIFKNPFKPVLIRVLTTNLHQKNINF